MKKNLKNTSENQKTLMQNSRLSCATVRTARAYQFTRLDYSFEMDCSNLPRTLT